MLKKISLLAASLLIAGCWQTKFNFEPNPDNLTSAYDETEHYFISGLGQQADIAPATICGGADKIVRVETQTSGVNTLLAWITFGIYTPQQARVYCKQ